MLATTCNHSTHGGVLGSVCIDCPAALATDPVSGFPTLVAHHRDLVYGVARRWSRSVEDAEDLTQEAFLRAYKAILGYSPGRIRDLHVRGWLARITLNLARNRARSVQRRPTTADLAEAPEPVDDRVPAPEQVVERRESGDMWRRLLGTLPPDQRAAVELRHVEGLSYPELAEALAKPLGTVKSDVHRGVARLRRAYEKEMDRAGSTGSTSDLVHMTRLPRASRPAHQLRSVRIEREVMAG